MNLNLTALAASLALGLSLGDPTIAQTKLVNIPTSGLLTAQYPSLPPGATPRPDIVVPEDTRSRPNVPSTNSRPLPGGPYGASQAYTFQGTSKSGNFQDALSDALDKARESLGTQDDGLDYRVLEIRGTAQGRRQRDRQLLVTIQVLPSGGSYSDIPQRSNFPPGQNPNFPPNQGGYYPKSVPPNYPQP